MYVTLYLRSYLHSIRHFPHSKVGKIISVNSDNNQLSNTLTMHGFGIDTSLVPGNYGGGGGRWGTLTL